MGKNTLLLAVIIGALIAGLSIVFLSTSLLPTLASEEVEAIDHTLRLLFAIAAGVFSLIVVILLYSVVRFRRRAGDIADGPPIRDNKWLLAAFLFIPLALVLWSASFGAVKLNEIRGSSSHEEELEVRVTAFQWAWLFDYPESGTRSGELRLPVNRPVLLKITSLDVIHSFWVPEFGPKMDAVPGMETELRITPTKEGDYQVLCAELCGLGHTFMLAPAKVVPAGEFSCDGCSQL